MEDKYQYILKYIQSFKKLYRKEYHFLPVAVEDELIAFENRFNIKIPDDYRWFLLNIANGIVVNNEWDWNITLLNRIDFNDYKCGEDEGNPALPFRLDKRVKFHSNESEEEDYPYEVIIEQDKDFYVRFSNGNISIAYNEIEEKDFLLIVNGKEFGNVWVDDMKKDEVYPYYNFQINKRRLNFSDWLSMKIDFLICNQKIEEKEEKVKRNFISKIVELFR